MRVGTWIEARPKLHIPNLINSQVDECHITMAYLGDANPEDVAEAMTAGSAYQQIPYEPILCEAHGTARWLNADGDNVDVILVSPVIPKVSAHTIYTEQNRVLLRLQANEISVDNLYPFVPHITMPGGWPADPNSMLPTLKSRVMFVIDRFYVSYTEKDDNGIKETKRIEIKKD